MGSRASKGSKNRELRAIAAVACPDCGAARGHHCVRRSNDPNLKGRVFICRGRRTAWQMVRDGEVK